MFYSYYVIYTNIYIKASMVPKLPLCLVNPLKGNGLPRQSFECESCSRLLYFFLVFFYNILKNKQT